MNCVRCAQPVSEPRARTAISIFVLGDEYIYSYWWCARCGCYTVEAYHDRFMGESEIGFLPPISKEEGDRAVAIIRACPTPHDKFCECASHRAMYRGRP